MLWVCRRHLRLSVDNDLCAITLVLVVYIQGIVALPVSKQEAPRYKNGLVFFVYGEFNVIWFFDFFYEFLRKISFRKMHRVIM
jgi:hypothetical protein